MNDNKQLEQGADRDKADNYGWTPLHWANHYGHLEIVMLLMSYGADLNARTNDGELPIDWASTEEIKQAIRDEPRRRMDEALGKRATEQDRHPKSAPEKPDAGGTNSFSGVTSITNSTASTTTSTGALVVTGGVGIGGNLNAGGTNSFSGVTSVTNSRKYHS